MNNRRSAVFGAALLSRGCVGSSAASAQTTFQNYRCADGTQFIAGFFQYDSRAHLQLDGKAVTLAKRLALSGSRYSGSGVTLKITKAGAHHAQARQTAGDDLRTDMKKGRNVSFRPFFTLPTAPELSGRVDTSTRTFRRHQWSRPGLDSSMAASWYQLPLQSARLTAAAANRRGLGLAVATSPESRPAPGRELIDLGRSLIHTRIHHLSVSLIERTPWCARLVLLWLPKRDIVRPSRNAS